MQLLKSILGKGDFAVMVELGSSKKLNFFTNEVGRSLELIAVIEENKKDRGKTK